ncbi:SusC/RagA family TonB-linked outer membrane protein [Spirosoma sp. KCTC 42546]|uniref:SusC/RagA family TonB-linked outer membrane protein n=1 Tax=Spirosoma sp. KCTC 42546 TaxID=2520506 RepID=UPI001AEFA861|nr:SusC/RagA family TonB-linked outer membrane protein [Spirosoma sp. KCTC 42546]
MCSRFTPTALPILLAGTLLSGFQPASSQTIAMARQQRTSVVAPVVVTHRLADVLNDLKVRYQTDILFEDRTVANLTVPADALAGSSSLENALSRLLKPFNLRYKQVKPGTWVVLTRKPTPSSRDAQPPANPASESSSPETNQLNTGLLSTTTSVAPAPEDIPISGTVRAADNGRTGSSGPLPGVSVVVKGTNRGTTTDANGRYQINIPEPATGPTSLTLVFSYVGYVAQEVVVNKQSEINVQLQEDNQSLNEVVVVGYGSVRKSDLTGSVTSLKAQDLTRGTNINLQQTLTGRSPGVQIYQKSGEPGATMSVQIRGITSITGNNDPLYVVDGLPVNDGTAIGSASAGGTTSNPNNRTPLNSLNPADIESIEILKDASASAIYGSRGANGVVIITTKKGKDGKLKVEYNGTYGVQKVAHTQRFMTGDEYTNVINSIIDLGKLTTPKVTGPNANTDWQQLLFENAPIQSHDLSFSGAGGNTRYYISAGYFNQDGIMLKSGTRRYNARVNLENGVANKYNVGISLTTSYTRDYYNATGLGLNDNASALYMAQNYDPTAPPYNADGSYYRSPLMAPMDNPLAVINGQYGMGDTYRTFGNMYAEYFLMPSLSAKVRVGVDLNDNQRYFWIDPTTLTGLSYNGYADVRDGKRGYYLAEGTLNFNKTINDHRISAVVGSTYERYTSSALIASSRSFALSDLTFDALGTGDNTLNGVGSGRQENKLVSFLGRVNYAFKGKYLLTGALRADGSARFGPNKRFGYFPSAALAWRIHDEDFLKSSRSVSELKLRASYGVTGNQPTANYLYFSTYSAGRNAVFNESKVSSLQPTRSANPDLQWESAVQADLGIDFGFFSGRLTGSADYYNRKTSNLLYDIPQPSSTGFGSRTENVGSMRNTGFEFSLKGIVLDKKDFRIDAGFNITTLKNRVLSLGNVTQSIGSGPGSIGQVSILKTGESIGSFYGYIVDGVWQTGDDFGKAQTGVRPGDLKYRDLDGNNIINASDRVILGKSLPDFYYGFNTNVSFKGLALDVFFEGSQGAKMLNSSLVDAYYPVDYRRNKLATPYLNRWTPNNPTNDYPSFLPNDVQGQRQITNKTVEDASYLRLQAIRLSYKLPVPKNRYISSASVFVNGQNLYTFTKYSGTDPAANALGDNILRIDYNTYPLTRTFTTGLNLQF